MKIDENLASVQAYLCADGYVIKNPEKQKHKYYYIGFRNTNLILLKDFQEKFERVFRIKPRLIKGERCVIQNKDLYDKLTKEFGSFYSWKWRMPKLNKKLTKIWLRTYFDCEGWVFCKSHQNRHIGTDCVNEIGLNQIISALQTLNIKTIKKFNRERNIYRILIYGRENLIKFNDEIGFLHPDKDRKLKEILADFVIYEWDFPKDKKGCEKFVLNILKEKIRIKKPYYLRIVSKEENNLKKLKEYLSKFFEIESIIYTRKNGLGTVYSELNINKKESVQKLINLRVINNLF